MRKKKTRTIIKYLVLTLLLCSLTGCADNTDVSIQNDVETIEHSVEAASSEQATAENITETEENADSCPEGYVYDYQVSMEPIPEEIAALGGTCQGTIHAFPSKIGMALTELEMENDPVLKAEVEKRIPEIVAALEEEIGGEFEVDGVILEDDLAWIFFCTEVGTGYQFELHYVNNEYYALKNNRNSIKNIVVIRDYYKEKESVELREELYPILSEIYINGDFKVRSQKSANEIDIVIVQYADGEVDKCIEQEKLLELWEELQSYDNAIYYNINLVFYPPTYKQVIEEKHSSVFSYDFERLSQENIVSSLKENNDILCCLNYSEYSNKDEVNNLDTFLRQYQSGEYGIEHIWEFWVQ